MKILVLGRCGPFARPGEACSSYLVTHGETRILLDMGSGSLANYLKIGKFSDLTAVVLSHLHYDHIGDAFLLKYALGNLRAQGKIKEPLPLYLPKHPEEIARQLEGPEFHIQWIHREEKRQIGEATLSFEEMTHPVPSYATKIQAGDKTLVYSGDTNKNERLRNFAAGADFFLVDGGLLSGGGAAPHLTAKEAAGIGREAEAKKTIITHLSPLYEEEEYARQAGSAASIAKPGAEYEI